MNVPHTLPHTQTCLLCDHIFNWKEMCPDLFCCCFVFTDDHFTSEKVSSVYYFYWGSPISFLNLSLFLLEQTTLQCYCLHLIKHFEIL